MLTKNGMRLTRFEHEGLVMQGRLLDGKVERLDEADRPSGQTFALSDVRLLTPVPVTKIWCVGLNYRAHAKETGLQLPAEPCIFMKPLTCLAAHEETVPFPSWPGRVDYEGELAVIIGKKCRNVSEQEALHYVMGYSCFDDVTARDIQGTDGQWIRSKSFDKFGPLGPCVLLTESMPPQTELQTLLNGKVVQKSPLSDMIFNVAQIIAHISRFATMEVGDVIATGTPSGIGPVHDGDVVEVSIDGIGVLKNRFALID